MCQYRRTEDEEESGSDWDEMTPRTTTASPAHLPHTTPTPSPAPSGGKIKEDVYAGGAPLQMPALEVTSNDRSAPTLLVRDTTNNLIPAALRPTPIRREGVVSQGGRGLGIPNKGVHWNSSDVGGAVLETLEDRELTSIAMVKPPQTPPLQPVPPAMYRTHIQTEGQEEEVGGARRGQRSPGRGAEGAGDEALEMEENYKLVLKDTPLTVGISYCHISGLTWSSRQCPGSEWTTSTQHTTLLTLT